MAFQCGFFGIGHIFLSETIVTFPLKLLILTHNLIPSIKSVNVVIYLLEAMHIFEEINKNMSKTIESFGNSGFSQ